MISRIKYYTDEHVARAVITGLRSRGVEVVSVQDAGLLGAPDEQHLEFALNNGLVIFTQDADFLRLHTRGIFHSGIVYTPQQTKVGKIIRGLMLIYQVLSTEEMINHIEFL